MSLNYTTRMEINLLAKSMTPADVDGLSTFMIKNRIPALVVSPQFIDAMVVDRATRQATYKIIAAIDFDNGNSYGFSKMTNLPKSIFAIDGYEILVTPNRNEKESANELRIIRDFFLSVNGAAEIRWVLGLGARKTEAVQNVLKHLKNCPANFIRNTQFTDVLFREEDHMSHIECIRENVASPIKLCGDITADIMSTFMKQVARFDVTVPQAKRIIKRVTEESNDSASAMDIIARAKDNNPVRECEHKPGQLRCTDKSGCDCQR